MVSSRGRRRPRGVKRKMSSYPLRPRAPIRNDRRKVEISMLLSEIDSIGASWLNRGFHSHWMLVCSSEHGARRPRTMTIRESGSR